MKRLLFASLLTVALAFAQATGGSTDTKTGHKGKNEKVTKTKKGAKSKKSSGGTTTQPPK